MDDCQFLQIINTDELKIFNFLHNMEETSLNIWNISACLNNLLRTLVNEIAKYYARNFSDMRNNILWLGISLSYKALVPSKNFLVSWDEIFNLTPEHKFKSTVFVTAAREITAEILH